MYANNFFNGLSGTGMSTDSTNVGFYELNQSVDDLINTLSNLKENIPNYWEGPAAENYMQVLINSINFTSLKELIVRLDNEVSQAKKQLEIQQASGAEK